MTQRDFEPAIRARLDVANANLDDATVASLARYLALLARWNRRINLTAFDLDRATDDAVDRLIVEPVVASGHVRATDQILVDVGSGGGSPSLPLKIVLPHLRMTLIEARVRKSAFLREAARELHLDGVRVETFRLDRGGRAELNGTADVATMRAVRADGSLLEGVAKLVAPHGQLLWFHDDPARSTSPLPAGWKDAGREVEAVSSFLRVLAKTPR